MHRFLIFLLVIGAAVCTPSTPVKNCPGIKEELYKKVVISTERGVCTKLPCDFISGKDIRSEITFEAKNEVKEITLMCNATSLGVTIQYPIPNASKGCDLLANTFCPLEPKTIAELDLKMLVSKFFPKVAVDLIFYLLDHNQKMISCFEVSGKVVN